MLVKVDLCQACAAKLRGIEAERGAEAMAAAAGAVLSRCETCSKQLPGHQPGAVLKTRLKPHA